MKRRRIFASVTDKTGLEKFKTLTDLGWEIVTTGGTATYLQGHGIPVTLVEKVTNFPEMLDWRVKTMHPKIHGGILADRSKPSHMAAILEHGIETIDVVVVNLYPFLSNPGIENIDIGGPAGLRAAAKNAGSVTVVVDPDDYDKVITQIVEKGDTNIATREELAVKVFERCAVYDRAICDWMRSKLSQGRIFDSEASATH